MSRTARSRTGLAFCSALAAVMLVAGSCSSDDTASDDTDSSVTTASTPGTVPEVVDVDEVPEVTLERTSVELDRPIALVPVPDSDSVLIATQDGIVHEATVDGDDLELVDEPVLDLTELVGAAEGEQGLLGLAVHPDGDRIYASYTASGDDGASRLDRYDLSGDPGSLTSSVDSRVNLLDVAQPFANHNGGHVVIGPDGMLYLGLGDGGSGGDPQGNAQDRDSLLGKILRLDPDATSPDDVAAPDNPFVAEGPEDQQGRPEIWLTGVRNPWRFNFDRTTGDLWVADVGQNAFEEISVLRAAEGSGRGANLGWDLYEGAEPFEDPDPSPGAASAGPFVEPVYVYPRDQGCSITGGYVYRGADIPALDGAYLFADYCSTDLRAIRVDGDRVESLQLADGLQSAVSFAEGADGELYVLTQGDGIHRVRPA